jgi:hypothetical protein
MPRAVLRRGRRTIQQVDPHPAAIAPSPDRRTVVNDDSDLNPVLGLDVESWAVRKAP